MVSWWRAGSTHPAVGGAAASLRGTLTWSVGAGHTEAWRASDAVVEPLGPGSRHYWVRQLVVRDVSIGCGYDTWHDLATAVDVLGAAGGADEGR